MPYALAVLPAAAFDAGSDLDSAALSRTFADTLFKPFYSEETQPSGLAERRVDLSAVNLASRTRTVKKA
jgi:hypothetical protein